jgi:uncharacterized protein (TIGR00106 family)
MVIAEVSVVPIGTTTPSVSQYVARAVRALKQQNRVKYRLTAMGTLLEGELSEVLEAARGMHESLFDQHVKRVITTIRIDDRRDKKLTMSYKVESVMKQLR